MAKYKYKIIIEVPEKVIHENKSSLLNLIQSQFPKIDGLNINEKNNEIEWHQDCGVEAVDVKEFINKL